MKKLIVLRIPESDIVKFSLLLLSMENAWSVLSYSDSDLFSTIIICHVAYTGDIQPDLGIFNKFITKKI